MLALKGILAQSDRISVLVFDEIDANVGGRLGSVIGNKLRHLAEHHQVLCITHLPQIASYADRHLTVRKEVTGNATETKVRQMEGPERLQELAEMIGGQRITDTTRAQAQELLDAARGEFAGTADCTLRPIGRKKRRANSKPRRGPDRRLGQDNCRDLSNVRSASGTILQLRSPVNARNVCRFLGPVLPLAMWITLGRPEPIDYFRELSL